MLRDESLPNLLTYATRLRIARRRDSPGSALEVGLVVRVVWVDATEREGVLDDLGAFNAEPVNGALGLRQPLALGRLCRLGFPETLLQAIDLLLLLNVLWTDHEHGRQVASCHWEHALCHEISVEDTYWQRHLGESAAWDVTTIDANGNIAPRRLNPVLYRPKYPADGCLASSIPAVDQVVAPKLW